MDCLLKLLHLYVEEVEAKRTISSLFLNLAYQLGQLAHRLLTSNLSMERIDLVLIEFSRH